MVFRSTQSGSKLRSNRGFSLIEVLVALAILMFSFTLVARAWWGSQVGMKKMKINNQAAFLLDYKVSDLERQYKDQITLLPEEDTGEFEEMGANYKSYTWKMRSKKFELPDMTSLLIKDQGKADPMMTMMLGQLKDFFAQAAKEVTVTIVYTVKKQKVEYSATTFLIDYNQQLPIPDMGGAGGAAPGTNTPGGNQPGTTTGGGGESE